MYLNLRYVCLTPAISSSARKPNPNLTRTQFGAQGGTLKGSATQGSNIKLAWSGVCSIAGTR
ncbi:hypothetical protein WG66_002787 [Moniliophthora roreri]|nr:hypothetical protein WG66_002787 [Moniliophthora roreri]